MSCRRVFYKVLGRNTKNKKERKKEEEVILEGEKKFQENKMCCMGDGKN